MLQLIWASIESVLNTLGLEIAAAIVASLVRQDGMTVASLVADVMFLTVLIIAVEKGLKVATQNRRIKWFLIAESVIGFGSLLVVWLSSGAALDAPIQTLVKGAGAYFVFPWVFVFVLSPLWLVWLELRELLGDLGGSTISRKTQLLVFSSFTAAWTVALFSPTWGNEWSWIARLLVAMLLAVVSDSARADTYRVAEAASITQVLWIDQFDESGWKHPSSPGAGALSRNTEAH